MLANGTLTNTAQLNASGAGNALDNENATNTGAIEVSGELLLDQGTAVDNTNGTVTVDNTGTLTLNDASIDHGAVTDNGTIDLTGAGVLANGSLTNTGQLNASGTGNALDTENVTNTGTIEVLAGGALTIDQASIVHNDSGNVTVDALGTLTLADATIDQGAVTDNGELNLTGTGVLANGTLTNTAQLNASGAGNALDTENVTNTGTIEVLAGGALTIDQASIVHNDSGNVTVDALGTLTLADATIDQGAVTDNGELDLTGAGVLANGTLTNAAQLNASGAGNALDTENVTNTGTIEVLAGGALTIDQASIVHNDSGNVTVDALGTLTLADATIDQGAVTDNGELDLTGAGVLANGTLTNTAQLNASGAGNALDNENATNTGAIEVSGELLLDQATGSTTPTARSRSTIPAR